MPSSFKSARPTITVAGQDQPQLAQGLLSLLIAENVNGLYRCEAVFGNWGNINNSIGFLYFGRDLLDFGKPFQVKLGTDIIFDGLILGMEAHFPQGRAPELNILAEDRFQDLRMTRRTRTFLGVRDADVIHQLANDYGLTPMIDVTGPQYEVLAQINQSDLAFLRERAHAIDAELWMSGNTINVQSHIKRAGGNLQITYGNDLREFSVLADLAGQRSSVSVSGWDVAGKQGLNHEATDFILNGELHGGTSGAKLLTSILGSRKEALVHTAPFTTQEAQAEAEAYFKIQARRFVTGHGIADANSQLQVGNYVQLQGLGPLFSGKYYLSEVTHIFDSVNGIRTEFTAESPGLGQIQ